MAQFIALAIILVIAKLIVDFIKSQFFSGTKTAKNKSGEVIDISDAWVDTTYLPYKKKECILSAKEQVFYNSLTGILTGKNYIVFPHIQMSELVDVTENPRQSEYVKRAKERTLDFAVLEAVNLKPVLVFKLDESNPGKTAKLSNNFTSKALKEAGLPFILLDLNKLPDSRDLTNLLCKHGINI